MFPLLGFRKYILLSQGCSEGDPAAIGRGCSSNKVNGPSLRDVKSGMQTVRGSNERQWSLESVVAGTTQDNKRKTIRWIPSRRKLQLPHTTVSIPLGLVQVQSLCYAMWQVIFLGNTFSWSSLFFLCLTFPFLPLCHSLPPSRQRYVSLSCFCACDFTAWGKSVRKVTSFIKYSICIQNCMYMKNVVVCCT